MKEQKKQDKILIENKHLNKWLQWLIDRRKQFFSILAIIVFSGIIIHKTIPLFGKRGSEGALLADSAYQDWKNAPQNYKALNDLRRFLNKYPDIKPKYEGLVVQQLLSNENIMEDSIFMANKALKRTEDELPLYSNYAYTSLLISEKKYEEALENAKKLKKDIETDLNFLKDGILPSGPILYTFNLLRIAFLEKEIMNNDKELSAWIELENYLNNSEKNRDRSVKNAIKIIKNSFRENSIELADYIAYRKSQLSSK